MTNSLPTIYQQFIHKSRYSRWIPEENRREEWNETITRYFNFFQQQLKEKHKYTLSKELRKQLENAILNLDIMPSMRSLMTSGVALERCNVAGYNCAYLPIDNPRAFDECLYILMCGTGVGFSVERDNIDKLPVVNEHFENSSSTIVVDDSKQGWAKGFRELTAMLYAGQIPTWDLSKLRPAGARLKTFGGRSSGPLPLNDLFQFTVDKFKYAAGRKLYPIECHDIICKIGDVVVVGGVRRSALISLSDLADSQMRDCKAGMWWETQKQRALANNSATYLTKPPLTEFIDEWNSLIKSQSGERGLFNREASIKQVIKNGRRNPDYKWGTNPCCEIILRPYQFCNLTEVIVREYDTVETLKNKVKLATILGTFQSTLTDFKYLRKIWETNTKEERLLGVSLTGILDLDWKSLEHSSTTVNMILQQLKDEAVKTNEEFSKMLNIPQSTAITCVKPSGTVSALVDSASGIHPRHSDYYIRTVRGDVKDPLSQFLISQGVPNEPCVMKPNDTIIFSFPFKAPEKAVKRAELTALEHLSIWMLFQKYWCEHKPSVTISVKDNEWLSVGDFVFNNFDAISGISFLPFSEHTYKQAPYQECNKECYDKYVAMMPSKIDWNKLRDFEKEDTTVSSQELACQGGVCEIINIGN